MTTWCPRCDAVRDAAGACPTCGTPLADVTHGRPRPAVAAPPDRGPLPPPPPQPPRLRAALAVAVIVLAGLAFLAGRLGGRSGPDAASGVQQAATSTTAPAATDQGRRVLGWTARRDGATVTATAVERVGDEGESRLTVRVDGLARGQEVLALAGLTLRDNGAGLFASPDEDQVGGTQGVPVTPARDGGYEVELGPTPALGALREIELTDLVVGKTSGANVDLATAGPWPSGAKRRTVDPGPKGTVQVTARTGLPVRLELDVTAAFVGGGRADAVIAVKPVTPSQALDNPVPVTAQLRVGDRVLCARTKLVGGAEPSPALVVGCPTEPVDRLTIALGAGTSTIAMPVTLRSSG
jgi:hypothetical protein